MQSESKWRCFKTANYSWRAQRLNDLLADEALSTSATAKAPLVIVVLVVLLLHYWQSGMIDKVFLSVRIHTRALCPVLSGVIQ